MTHAVDVASVNDHELSDDFFSTATLTQQKVQTKLLPIEQIQLGMRLPGENPDRSQVDPFELDPDPLTWKRVAMVGTLETGETLETELLRPKEWFDDNQIHVGKFLPLAISEIGRITGVTVTEITRCPPIEPGEGNVCTGRFKRLTPELVRIDLKEANESLFTTGPHPIWSDTEGDFINAEHMTDPHTVRTELGPDTAHIGQVVKRTTVVYNIEAHAEHVYLAGVAGLLVHNSTNCVGQFSIINWSNYPSGVPKPSGPFELLSGDAYRMERNAANAINNLLHKAKATAAKYKGKHIHEIHPVKFGGSPTNLANKIGLDPGTHFKLNKWWSDLQRTLENL